jgi:hypothetical protein
VTFSVTAVLVAASRGGVKTWAGWEMGGQKRR